MACLGPAGCSKRPAPTTADPVALVLFERTVTPITEQAATQAAKKALGIDATAEPVTTDLGSGFLLRTVKYPPIAIIVRTQPYLTNAQLREHKLMLASARARQAVDDHQGCIAVEAYGLTEEIALEERELIYDRVLGAVAAELIDKDSLIIFAPAEHRFGPVRDTTPGTLRSGHAAEALNDDELNGTVVDLEGNPDYDRTITEVRNRLPEFIAAFEKRGSESRAIVKRSFYTNHGDSEVMWARVKSIKDGVFTGVLVNSAMNPELPKLGETVTASPDEVVDWAFQDEKGKIHGDFISKLSVIKRFPGPQDRKGNP